MHCYEEILVGVKNSAASTTFSVQNKYYSTCFHFITCPDKSQKQFYDFNLPPSYAFKIPNIMSLK